jgi:hypothetical protein
MRERLTLDDLLEKMTILRRSERECVCHGQMKQLDAKLPDNRYMRLMKSMFGYHVIIAGSWRDISGQDVPDPLNARQLERLLIQELGL